MQIAAVAPEIPWSDLVHSLMPNGRTLDYVVTGPTDDLSPVGVQKTTFVAGLFATGEVGLGVTGTPTQPTRAINAYYAPPGADPDADLTTWYAALNAGDPYDESPLAADITNKVAHLKSAYYLPMDRQPAPILISNGFTDDLFPVDEAIRYVNKELSLFPSATVAQLHFDWGHQRGQNKPADTARLRDSIYAWFDHYVKGDVTVPVASGVEVWTQTCPKAAASAGPYRAARWWDIHPGEVRFDSAAAQPVLSASGDPTVAKSFDPVAGGGACATAAGADQQGVASYRLPSPSGAGYTLMGAPTIVADLAVHGTHTALAGRLVDVAPDGTESLVARGLYRPRGDGRQVWQLHPGAWHFAAGHQPKLELLGQDAPYGRPQNIPFEIDVSSLQLRLPVAEAPDCTQILSPAAPVLPYAGATLAPGVPAAPVDTCAPPPPPPPPPPAAPASAPPGVAPAVTGDSGGSVVERRTAAPGERRPARRVRHSARKQSSRRQVRRAARSRGR
jgi:hypothetical protein